MRPIRAFIRIVLFLLLSLATIARLLLAFLWMRVVGTDIEDKRSYIHRRFVAFVKQVQRIMGIRIQWEGQFPEKPAVLMGNHRSYVDAILFPVGFPVVYVGRVESKSWPVIGWGASLLGTIWVDRQSKDSRRATRAAVRNRLQEGMGIVIFPEGTTFKGPELLEYRPGMFYTCA